ncbi:MAG: extracellular solute-binding protein [Acidobacteriota bacterium]|nr:extracellular solute-binding protein [Blastocatellia bacterium]MDW8412833.1 extracellular solute-binding protein [Acidobacteriota bacterium]
MTDRLLKIFTAVTYAFLYIPIGVLVVLSFNDSKYSSAWRGFTWKWYIAAWNNSAIIDACRTSLLVALFSTAISTIIGTAAAVAIVRLRFRFKAAVESLFYLPVIVPEIVVGFATVIMFSLLGLKLGLSTIVIAHVAFTLSYVIFIIRARLISIGQVFEQAAMDLGATELQAFLLVTLPMLMPAVVSAALLAFTLSLDDYVITSFVAGGNYTTLTLQIYSMVKTGVTPEINAISTILLVVTILLVWVSKQLEKERPPRSAYLVAVLTLFALLVFAASGTTRSTSQRQLNLYIWSNYISKEVVRRFEQRYNVRVNIETYESNEALLAKLQSGIVDYDIVVPSDYMVGVLIKQALLQPLDKDVLSNLSHIDDKFLSPPYDPDNRYSIPYTWGTTGIGYRKDKVEAPTSWKAMWDVRYKDRISMLNDMRENFAVALKQLGVSVNSIDESKLAEAAKLLKQQKEFVKTYDSDTFTEALLSGEVWLAQSYSGQVGKAMLEDPNIGYVVPSEGSTIWTDNLCIPKTAPHPELAMLFINYLLEPEVAAENCNAIGYATPNIAAKDLIRREFISNPAIFADEDTLKRCEFMQDLGSKLQLYDKLWTEIRSD